YVPEEKKKRFAQIYRVVEPGVFAPDTEKHFGMEGYDEKPAFESGGAGLVSTVEDYGKFAMMLANGGTYDGVRILSPYTVEFMGNNQLDAQCRRDLTWETLRGYGYGNLCRVMDTPQCTGCSVQLGAFGWDGWTGNYFLIDPVENMVIMYVIQKCDGTDDKLVRKLLNAVYGALC
ncbi:MAG TPA: serine hydrolase, partial [Eubacterium sp.]|nr:serine hydrolase [Eubacterium sp.]